MNPLFLNHTGHTKKNIFYLKSFIAEVDKLDQIPYKSKLRSENNSKED